MNTKLLKTNNELSTLRTLVDSKVLLV